MRSGVHYDFKQRVYSLIMWTENTWLLFTGLENTSCSTKAAAGLYGKVSINPFEMHAGSNRDV